MIKLVSKRRKQIKTTAHTIPNFDIGQMYPLPSSRGDIYRTMKVKALNYCRLALRKNDGFLGGLSVKY
ncbi:hypothetical protein SAMN06295967_1262 [Belliella buryatensis]|uniref:Uncharacterized protein n=1 Tax=Belliella buryatensis TaxID=1500549 RepID=A0A239H6I2_9BACT|nr:hypothetical protein SAMN06295967_1262 [Belliella buryatensis]